MLGGMGEEIAYEVTAYENKTEEELTAAKAAAAAANDGETQ